MPWVRALYFLLSIPFLHDLFVYGAPSSQRDLTASLTNLFDAALNEDRTLDHRSDSRNQLVPGQHGELSPRWDKLTWPQLADTVEEMSGSTKRGDKDDQVAHIPLPKGDGSTLDLQIAKDTICNSAKFTIGIVPGQTPKDRWKLVTNKTYGEIAEAMQGSSEEDIGKASKSMMDAVLEIGKPIFGHISGASSCKAVFPAPQKRDLMHFPHSSVRRDSVDQVLEAARSYVLRFVEDARILYYAGIFAAAYNVVQTMRAGGFVFVGGAEQGNPQATAARARVHSWAATISLYTILEQFQKAMGWETVSQVVSMKVIHPLANALFDGLQKIWKEIKPQKEGDDGNGNGKQRKRDDPSTCVNVNDFKFFVQNIGSISKQDVDEAKAKKPQSCPVPIYR